MLKILSLDADNVIGCAVDGKINIEDIEIISNIIDEKLKTHDKLRVYVEVNNLDGISLKIGGANILTQIIFRVSLNDKLVISNPFYELIWP